jgi:capsular exopolysaccharide synthesis family protein
MFLSPGGERPKLVLITSAVPNEGKSSVTANLSRMLALGGATVMVLDADMRRGCLDQLMGLRKSPGLADLLLNRSDLEQVIQTGSPPNLSFIGRGASEGNPGDLFLNPLFDQLLITLRQRYDYVLIDSCPVFVANDATTLAPKMDGTLFVVRNRFSSARAVEEAVNLLLRRHAKVLGVVFNRAKVTGRSYYYYKSGEYYPPAAVT